MERVVSSSMYAPTPFATALKYPWWTKFSTSVKKDEPFTLKTPSVISTVPEVEQFLQLTLTLSSTEPSLCKVVRMRNRAAYIVG